MLLFFVELFLPRYFLNTFYSLRTVIFRMAYFYFNIVAYLLKARTAEQRKPLLGNTRTQQ
jgi:hypothetical protein